MSWLVLTLMSLLAWAVVDVLSKYVSTDDDPDAHWELIIWVGLLLIPTLFSSLPGSESGMDVLSIIRTYRIWLIVPLCYFLCLLGSYYPLKYLEISIVSPICNTAGAISVIVLLIYYFSSGSITSVWEVLSVRALVGIAVITTALVALGIVEEKLAIKRGLKEKGSASYRYGALALLIPVIAAVFEASEGILAGLVLDESRGFGVGENDYWIMYSVFCIAAALIIWIYLFIKNGRPYNPFSLNQWPKALVGILEVLGEAWWLKALAAEPLLVAFLSCTYCAFTVVLSRIFLKEKMTKAQYICVAMVIIGIVIVGN